MKCAVVMLLAVLALAHCYPQDLVGSDAQRESLDAANAALTVDDDAGSTRVRRGFGRYGGGGGGCCGGGGGFGRNPRFGGGGYGGGGYPGGGGGGYGGYPGGGGGYGGYPGGGGGGFGGGNAYAKASASASAGSYGYGR